MNDSNFDLPEIEQPIQRVGYLCSADVPVTYFTIASQNIRSLLRHSDFLI